MDKKQSMMNILSDRDISSLLKKLILLVVVFNIIAIFITLNIKSNTFLFITINYFVMSLSMIFIVYIYFSNQNKIINNAIKQIQDYINKWKPRC